MLFTGKSGKRHCPSGREKKACYDGIADALAAVGPTRRAASEVRHKKENWFSAVKKKVAVKKTKHLLNQLINKAD